MAASCPFSTKGRSTSIAMSPILPLSTSQADRRPHAKRSSRRPDSRKHAGDPSCAPRTAKPRGGEAPGVHSSGDHRLRLKSLTPQFLDDAPRLAGAAFVKRLSRILHSRGMRPAMSPHGEIEVMRGPAAARGSDALGIQSSGELDISGRAARPQVVDQEADARGLENGICAPLRWAGCTQGSHGRRGLKANERSAY